MKHVCFIAAVAVATLIVSSSTAEDEPAPAKYAVKAGKILTMAPGEEFVVGKGIVDNGVVLGKNIQDRHAGEVWFGIPLMSVPGRKYEYKADSDHIP